MKTLRKTPGMLWLNLVLLLLCLAGAGVYNYLIPESEVWSWRHTLVGTLVSVLLALLLFHYQTHLSEKSRLKQLRLLLVAELGSALDALRKTEPLSVRLSDGQRLEVTPVLLQTLILEEASRSGLLGNQTRTMLELVRLVRSYNWQLDRLFSALALGTPEALQVAKYYEQVTQQQQQNLQVALEQFSKELCLPIPTPVNTI